jgi:hypothetical protein
MARAVSARVSGALRDNGNNWLHAGVSTMPKAMFV